MMFMELTLKTGKEPVWIHLGAVKYFCLSPSGGTERHSIVSFGHDRIVVVESPEEIAERASQLKGAGES
jgi:hypothetical protein